MNILDQINDTYIAILAQIRPLLRVLCIWFVIAVIGQMITGAYDLSAGEQLDLSQIGMSGYIGTLVHLIAILVGWYAAHRYLMNPVTPAPWLPEEGLKSAGFVAGQLRNMALLLLLSIVAIIPLAFYFSGSVADMTDPAEQAALNQKLTYFALPIFFLFFSRLLLVAPMTARSEPKAVSRSWQLTKGHFIRLNLLQAACIVPVIICSIIGAGLQHLGHNSPVLLLSAAITVAGTMLSFLLYTQLAEDEYKKLAI